MFHQERYDVETDGPEEEAKRFGIFKCNVEDIINHNEAYTRGETSYTMGINQFTDLTQKEFEMYYVK